MSTTETEIKIDGPAPATPTEVPLPADPDFEEGPDPEEPAPDEEPILPEAAAKQAGEPPLFDPAPYTEAPEFDGQTADKLTVAFSGGVAYEIGDALGQAFFDKLELGHELELRVSATVVAKAGKYKRNKDDEETITGHAQVKVDTVYLVTPEEL